VHEIKHDGFRTLLVIEGEGCRAFTGNGHDWTKK
jgi:ATP-dependent DNA ligase